MDFKNKPVFAMIHLAGGDKAVARAISEIEILINEGVDGIIIENYHGNVDDIIGTLDAIQERDLRITLGINILPNDFEKALKLADYYHVDFIQLDYVAGKYERNIELDKEKYKDLREKYPHIKVLGGVWPKYYEPVLRSNLLNDLKEAMSLCDAIVVTGSGTGKETPLHKIKDFRTMIGDFPLIIGAGLEPSNVIEQFEIADGGIVGSCLKPFKRTQELIDSKLVQEFMAKVKEVRSKVIDEAEGYKVGYDDQVPNCPYAEGTRENKIWFEGYNEGCFNS